MAGRPPKEKSFANMLRIAVTAPGDDGEPKLRQIAEKLVDEALKGEAWAVKEVADRIDGKVPQAVVGDSDEDPINMRVDLDAERFTRAIAGLVARGGTPETSG